MKFYNHKATLALELLNSPIQSCVIYYILSMAGEQDNYLFTVSPSEFGRHTSVHRSNITPIIKDFQTKGILKLEGKSCTFYTSKFYSILEAYSKLNQNDRDEFREAFSKGDNEAMTRLGFTEKSMSELGSGSGESEADKMLQDRELAQIVEYYYNNIQKRQDFMESIIDFVRRPDAKARFKEEVYNCFDSQIENKYTYKTYNYSLSKAAEDVPFPLFAYILFSIADVSRKTAPQNLNIEVEDDDDSDRYIPGPDGYTGYEKPSDRPVCATDYMYEDDDEDEDKNDMDDADELDEFDEFNMSEEDKEMKEEIDSLYLDRQDADNEDDEDSKEEKKEKFFTLGHVDIPELIPPKPIGFDLPTVYVGGDYPKIPESEVRHIMGDIEYASTDPLKLFIHMIWLILEDNLDEDFEVNEDGAAPKKRDIRKRIYRAEDFEPQILRVAYEEIEGFIAKGEIDLDDNSGMPLTFSEIFPYDMVRKAVRWKIHAVSRRDRFVPLSSVEFYNILERPSDLVKKPNNNGERAAARADSEEYMQKIWFIKKKNLTQYKLTDCEEIMWNFMDRYLVLATNFEGNPAMTLNMKAEGVNKSMTLAPEHWRMRVYEAVQKGMCEDDLFDIIFSNTRTNEYGNTKVNNCLFLASAVRVVNYKYGQHSVIDSVKLDEIADYTGLKYYAEYKLDD